MAESACLVHPLPYVPALSIEPKQVNPMDALGDSISFGRFMTESLDWEKWSTFSHKRYVEEAERHAQPGLVAQKKAFFEDHYKRIAAKKAAADALLEQENLAKDSQPMIMNPQVSVDENPEIKAPDSDSKFNDIANEKDSNAQLGRVEDGELKEDQLENVEKIEPRNLNSNKGASLMMSEKKPVLSSLKSNVPSSPKSLDALISSVPQDSDPQRVRTSVDPSAASGRKTTGRKWHILSTIFCLRTEERTSRRKQKLEEKLNAKEAQKVKQQTKSKKKAETEPRKSHLSLFCFKARP